MVNTEITKLIDELHSTDWDVQLRASRTSASYGECAVQPLIGILAEFETWDDCNSRLHKMMALTEDALVAIGHASVEPLIAVLPDHRWGLHAGSIWCLGEIGDSRAIQPLIDLLKDDYTATSDIGEVLAKFHSAALAPLLTAMRDESAILRMHSAFALGLMGDSRVVEPLINLLQDQNHDVRLQAISSLGHIADERSIAALTALFNNSTSDMRDDALYALSELRATDVLRTALDDNDPEIRELARELLSELDAS